MEYLRQFWQVSRCITCFSKSIQTLLQTIIDLELDNINYAFYQYFSSAIYTFLLRVPSWHNRVTVVCCSCADRTCHLVQCVVVLTGHMWCSVLLLCWQDTCGAVCCCCADRTHVVQCVVVLTGHMWCSVLLFTCRQNKRPKFYVDENCHAQTIAVVRTRARWVAAILSPFKGRLADKPCHFENF